MGRSPGKWFKSILLGKKSSKSNLSNSKRNAKEKEVLASPELPALEISAPLILPTVASRNEAARRHEVVASEDVTVLRTKEEESEKKDANFKTEEDPESIRRESAAIKTQAAVRGYLARREFQILKGIIRLQAFIRGHLVRRQAVATLRCMQAIIRFQALIRGQKVRMSTIGIEVQNKCDLGKLMIAKSPNALVESATTITEQPMDNAFARKLLTSLSSTTPLCVQYGPGEPNSDWEWVERWTRSKFWESHSQPKSNIDLKSQTQNKHNGFERRGETEEHGRAKQSVRKLSSSNVENVSSRATSDSDKPKRNTRKSSSYPVDSRQEHNRNEVEKVKGNRKTFDSKKPASERIELDNAEKKHTERRASGNATSSEQGATVDCADKKTDTAARISKQSDAAGLKLTSVSDHSGALHERPGLNLQPMEDNGEANDIMETKKQLNSNGHNLGDESLNTSQRRASFPLNFENGVLSMRKVPSYMAPTESVRAKLKAQGSPRFSQDEFDKNAMTRRHSLPSANNGKLTTMSPRVQKLVHAAGKGAIRSDISLTSSRDSSVSDKLIKPEWRR